MTGAIDTIEWDRDFKVLCDGLLRFELGELVQTFGSDGSDGGVDAEFNGPVDGITGRWVFQYKFRSPKYDLQNRRSWLKDRYVGSKSRPSEFDKLGVKAALGYVLMTNIPVTPFTVAMLKKEWQRRKHKGPFCVWDPSRMNALLKGHEHLARSWTGAKEARCHQMIIQPLWQWLDGALTAVTNWPNDPLWPLDVQKTYEAVPLPAFGRSFEGREELIIGPRTNALAAVLSDPQFHYAARIAYPRALQPFDDVRGSVDVLAKAVLRHIDDLGDQLTQLLPQLQKLGSGRANATRVLAYCVLERRWGFPMRMMHSIREGRLLAHGRYRAWDIDLADIEPTLDVLVRDFQHGSVGEGIVSARAEVASRIRRWWERMWHVVSFGIDAEDLGETRE